MLNTNLVHHYAPINDITLHYAEAGQGLPVVLCHGFPHTWYVWHRQVQALVEAGCRVIIPSMRGMGESSAPTSPESYSVSKCCADLLGLLEAIGEERAVFSGIDFGLFAIYDFSLRYPDRVIAQIAFENPAAPHNPDMPPLQEYREQAREHFLHINYFCEQPGRADADLLQRIELFFPRVFWALSGKGNYFNVFNYPRDAHYIDALDEAPVLPWPWLSEQELEVFITAYRKSGFTGGLNWYRSMDIKWEERKATHNLQSGVPTYFIGSEHDLDLKGFHGDDPLQLLYRQFPNVKYVEMIPDAGHLVQLEASGTINELMVRFTEDIAANLA